MFRGGWLPCSVPPEVDSLSRKEGAACLAVSGHDLASKNRRRNIMIFRTLGLVGLALSLSGAAGAQGLPKAQTPEEVGLSAARLKRLSDRINEGVKAGELPGAVVL